MGAGIFLKNNKIFHDAETLRNTVFTLHQQNETTLKFLKNRF